MSWALRIEHQPEGLRLRFPEPLATLDMTSETAAHLASLLAVEARHRLAGVVRTLEAENKPNALGELVSIQPTPAHPLCCDCEPCLNGDHDGR